MKIFLWLLTLALAVMCFWLSVLAHLEIPLLNTASIQLPGLTQMLVASPNWLWFCPVPWVLAAFVLSLRKEVSSAIGFLFLGTIVLAASVILFPFLIAAAMPWLADFGHSIAK